MTEGGSLKVIFAAQHTVQPQRGCVSIPHISFVSGDLMFARERAHFVLKTHLSVMFLLTGNVFFGLF